MCGISGFVNYQEKLSVLDLLNFNRIISHRGPDGEGFWLKHNKSDAFYYTEHTPTSAKNGSYNYLPKDDISISLDCTDFKIGLGHRRLSIVDLSYCGHQPMSLEDGDIVITYNGEIYNYKELREELTSLGYSFRSKTDTEVIMCAYKEWGLDCLHRFNGMFAFLLYDKSLNKLFAVRDRFGVKPLYYYATDAFITFASEIKQFTTLPCWKAELNHKPAQIFLWSGILDYSHETLFKNIHQVRGGHYLEIDLGDDTQPYIVHKWYDIKAASTNKLTYKDSVRHFKSLFTSAVDLRLKADVSIGTGLSGGLDSSSIVCTSSTLSDNADSHFTFSARSEDLSLDEGNYIDEVIKKTGVKNFAIWPTLKNLDKKLTNLIWHQDEPFGGTSYFAEWEIYETVKNQDIKVTLEGHGADELLLGYQYNFITYCSEMLRRFKFIRFAKLLSNLVLVHKMHVTDIAVKIIRNIAPKILSLIALREKNHEKVFFLNSHKDIFELDFYKNYSRSFKSLKRSSLNQLLYSSLPHQLHSADRSSMAFSIESRAPFLDYRIAEFLYHCPSSFKIDNEFTKKILRDAMLNILPEPIRIRKSKIGFATPEEKWVQDNSDFFKSKLLDIDVKYKNFIKPNLYKSLLDIAEGKAPYNPMLWRVICFTKWLEIFNVETDAIN